MKNMLLLWIPSVALMACDAREPYYAKEGMVSISGLDVTSEQGNIGGQLVEIAGSGFGTDIYGVTVMFGNQNADIVAVTDSLMTVRVPHGPLSGGRVDVRVGTADGQDTLIGGYFYNIPGNGIPAVYGEASAENQIAYVSVANDMMSCYGGTGTGEQYGCQTFALTGSAGIEGRAEGLEIVYPKAQAPYALGKGGFSNNTTYSWNSWTVTTDPFSVVTFDDENSVEDFRLNIGEFVLSNPAKSGSFCANLPSMATFVYNGSDAFVPSETNTITGALINPELAEAGYYYESTSVGGSGDFTTNMGGANGCYEGAKEYQLDELRFCMTDEYQKGETRSYQAEWPIADNFFMGQTANGQLSAETSIPVDLKIDAAHIDQRLILPPYAKFSDTVVGGEEFWALSDFTAECPDTDDDRVTTAEDSVFNWTWEPIDFQKSCSGSDGSNGVCVEVPNGVKGIHSYVTVSVSYLAFSWMGGEGITQYANITVPDHNNFDAATGLSSVNLPTWVMYSFPTAQNDYGESQGQMGQTSWRGYGDSNRVDNGLVVISIDRVVEYVIPTEIDTLNGGVASSVSGDLVFAYSTGDMGYFSFANPLDAVDACSDCLDNDGDGWTDAADPDCQGGNSETNLTTLSTCNDGIDNDQDGLIDAADDNCTTGLSGESADCSDNADNDGDGWVDQEDPDCQDGGVFEENPVSVFTCNDGIDNDGDGWIDIKDIACSAATDSEDDGFADVDGDGNPDYGCNDGIDNDGHGDIDSADVYCARRGATSDEIPSNGFVGQCADGTDNDSDGYIDGNDPACELTNGNSEFPATYDNTLQGYSALGNCNDGIDNDCDGLVDADDVGCWLNGVADGFITNEEDDGSDGTCNCGDAIDNDGDGWVDIDDPDCAGSEFGSEVGFMDADGDGNADFACNDGIDNDNDGLIDSLDVYCWERSAGAEGTAEAPSSAGPACSNGSDDDNDGYIDMADPGCEDTNGGSEGGSLDLAHWGNPTCFNGTDDDADGLTDAADPDCAHWYDAE